MLKRSWLFTSTYITNIASIYGVLMPYTPHMNSWVLDEWLYYELLRKTTDYTKEKSTYVYEALTYYYETMTMASPTLHFQAVFQKKTNSPTTGYYAVLKFIEEIFYWLDKHAIIEFTLTLISCHIQIYLAESRMVGIQTGSVSKSLVIH